MQNDGRGASRVALLVTGLMFLGACADARRLEQPRGGASECTQCHGGVDNSTGAPPAAIRSGASGTASPGIGAHTAHVATGPLAVAMACTECHPDPRAGSSSHLDGRVDVAFGSRATAGATLAPVYAASGSNTCSNTYCHGSFPGGNAANAPVWTKVDGTQAACGTCHGLPPPAPHVQRSDCGSCHPGYTATTVDVTAHVNGTIDLGGTSCTSCHGDAARLPTAVEPLAAAAPPIGVAGEKLVTDRAVGAHERHLTPGALSAGIRCDECHVVPSSLKHANGTVDVAFGSVATAAGAAPRWNGATCSSTYCHGAFPGGNGGYAPEWTRQAANACGTCHGLPPPAPHPQNTACGGCHPGYTASSVNPATHVNGVTDVGGLTCSSCHGDAGRSATALNPRLAAAPPAGTRGETLTSERAVGAHQLHLGSGTIVEVACTECHTVPTSMNHANGKVELNWGPVATAENAVPTWNGTTCSNTYCHGNFRYGNKANAPDWTRPAANSCGTCHGLPPPAPHTQRTGCIGCHPPPTASTHLNGKVDFAFTCAGCHGDPSRPATALNPQLAAAPPTGTLGETDPSQRAVGAHQRHLTAGPMTAGVACNECHQVPTQIGHATGKVELSWGPTAVAQGATPQWNGATCSSTYCHGAFKGGNASYAPDWTHAATNACGTCHGIPPPLPHPQNPNCGGCHPGYTSSSVDPATHVNGTLELGNLTCSSCHGDSTRSPTGLNPQLAAAPPMGTRGETDPSQRAVGAHQRHLVAGNIGNGIACTECHQVPTSMSHPTGTVELAWGPLAKTGNSSPTWNGATCSNTYCHGNFRNGSTTYAPTWTTPAADACGTCHGLPPGGNHPSSQSCSGCHEGYTRTSVNPANHLNGKVDLLAMACTSCHGDASRVGIAGADLNVKIAPPQTATARPAGAHLAHVNRAVLTSPVGCADCHQGTFDFTRSLTADDLASHPSGNMVVAFAGRAAGPGPDTTDVVWNRGGAPSYDGSSESCATTYCHGNYAGTFTYSTYDYGSDTYQAHTVPFAGGLGTPAWTDGPMTCGSCHGNPPPTGTWHLGHPYRDCQVCHPDATGSGGVGLSITDPSQHVNGQVEVAPRWSSSCFGCH